MSPLRIALVVDNPTRDLPGLALIAQSLASRGATCHLVPSNLAWWELPALAPDFVLLNYLRRQNAELAALLLNSGIQVGVLETEGGVLPSFDYYRSLQISEDWIRKDLHRFFSWGPKLAQWVVDENFYRPEVVQVTGNPRFDFYKHPWKNCVPHPALYEPSVGQSYVLINVSFSLTNPKFVTREHEADLWVAQGHDRAQVQSWQTTQQQTLEEMCDLTRKLSEEAPDTQFIFRPHPFEKRETYEDAFSKLSNVTICNKGDVAGWIVHAKAIIHRGSTTSVEAGLAGVPALTPTWIPLHAKFDVIDAMSVPCESFEKLLQEVQRPTARTLSASQEAILHEWFSLNDGRAHSRVANAILDSLSQRHTTPYRSFRKIYHASYPLRAQGKNIVRKFRHQPLEGPDSKVSDWESSDKHFSVESIRDFFLRFNRTSPKIESCQNAGEYLFGSPWGRSIVLSHR